MTDPDEAPWTWRERMIGVVTFVAFVAWMYLIVEGWYW